MDTGLFVGSIPILVDESTVFELFNSCAPVLSVERTDTDDKTWCGIVEMLDEPSYCKALTELNRKKLQGKKLYVRPLRHASQWRMDKDMTSDEADRFICQLMAVLNETELTVMHQLKRLLALCGKDCMIGILNEAYSIQDKGGLMVRDLSRQRTFGGVYLHLANGALFKRTGHSRRTGQWDKS